MNTGKRRSGGKQTDRARAILTINGTRVLVGVEEYHAKDFSGVPEPGHNITLGFTRGPDKYFINLTLLTHAELQALKEILDLAFANAQDICIMRDKYAREALYKDGDDSFTRLYRPVPELITREGEKWPDYPRLRSGLEWVAYVVRDFRYRRFTFKSNGKHVLERIAADNEPSDLESEAGLI